MDRPAHHRPAPLPATSWRALWSLAIAFLAIASAVPVATAAAPEPPWHPAAPGLELAVFTVGQASLHVLRCDPERWETVALAVSEVGGPPRTPRVWGEEFGLTAVINAGMFAADLSTHIGYFRTGEHVNNPIWQTTDYRQAACFEPREPDLPRFVLVDLDEQAPAAFADRFEIVVQNLRLIRKPGENRWPTDTRPWVEASLGEDDQGRQLWIFCREPLTMHAFNEILLELPLQLVAAQHLEGGRQAQLWVDPRQLTPPAGWPAGRPGNPAWPLPNVLGLRPRSTP